MTVEHVLSVVVEGLATWSATLGGAVIVRTLLRETVQNDPEDDPAFDLKIGSLEVAVGVALFSCARLLGS